jgi:hypothetical protein
LKKTALKEEEYGEQWCKGERQQQRRANKQHTRHPAYLNHNIASTISNEHTKRGLCFQFAER